MLFVWLDCYRFRSWVVWVCLFCYMFVYCCLRASACWSIFGCLFACALLGFWANRCAFVGMIWFTGSVDGSCCVGEILFGMRLRLF